MRSEASVLHIDLDAFFAAVEQRDKPSLRGKPVIVGGVGGRGVVATASYEARVFGVRSAMSTREARARCPHAAFLTGRFHAYRATSRIVMDLLRSISPLVEPLSIDEAFVDLEPSGVDTTDLVAVRRFGEELREQVRTLTGGLTASVGIGTSKFIAKVASDLEKPDGLVLVAPGTERAMLRPMQATVLPGVGPATAERLRRVGVHTVAELEKRSEGELIRILGRAHGLSLHRLARAIDDRAVEPERETKSVSTEGTYADDLTDRAVMEALLTRYAGDVSRRLSRSGLSGRTVTIKVRLHDFTTMSRSATLASPTDDAGLIARTARSLLADLETSGGVRLLGVGVSGLADWVQDDLFSLTDEPEDPEPEPELPTPLRRGWAPGMDVAHPEYGRGWVWGSGRQVVTVRFETAETGPGPVRSFHVDDPDLTTVTEPDPASGGEPTRDRPVSDVQDGE
ncbi:DNA polymerase IV [Nocardioides daejeonensis]|uniref:DNA polymerase IV n=1 Tax=Nocardioides daejeonensis TaxID=1046556 RepID=UPI000D747CDB|nr:DNA polymerase IV [Nocardioides daejeonensis]